MQSVESMQSSGNIANAMLCDAFKEELLLFTLKRVTVKQFNLSIKNFQNQLLWRFVKTQLMEQYPQYKTHNGYCTQLNMVMTEVFRPYTCEEIKLNDMRYKIDALERTLKMYQKLHPVRCALIKERNSLVIEYNELLKPQNDLIKLFKKIRKENAKKLP